MIGTTTSRDINDIVALTDGNPLFVTEMMSATAGEVPLSVRDAVLARAAKLSPRARETLDLISVIPGPAEIADRLFLSPRTVEHHVSAILSKLDASTREEAVSAATAQGLIRSR